MTEHPNALLKSEVLSTVQAEEFDVLIIGGGITGAGIALDAASRGMKTVLVEMQDFAAGTSSRSTKMIHGGLRYLKNLEVKIVAETGKERAVVYENGPHVTKPEWLLLPIYKDGSMGKFTTSIGLRVYDFLAGVKKEERKSMLTRERALHAEPKLRAEGLLGAGRFVEYRSDDARLTIEVMKEAVSQGATVFNYTKVTDFIYNEGKVAGVSVVDQLSGKTSEIRAKTIVNAAGPWVDTLREKDNSLDAREIRLTKGIHLVFDQSVFPLNQIVYFDTPDGRMVLAIPRDGKTYVGTTDTDYKGDMVHPRMTVSDRDYLMDAIALIFPKLTISASDIESSWVGLRPLINEKGKGASEVSRKDEIWASASGLITIAGGKLTGYRKMAETIVDVVASKLKTDTGTIFSPSSTKNMPISGGHVGGSRNFETFMYRKIKQGVQLGLDQERAQSLVKKYGSNVDILFDLIQKNEQAAQDSGLPLYLYAQVLYSITDEFVRTPIDFFWRRTGALLFDIQWVNEWKVPVLEMMSKELGWSDEQKASFHADLGKHLHDATVPVERE
ncbi:glycerol-3-phosphate dehydrogenase/oxidase [Sporosarcina sp. P26b]|uniref:glycerol-3-phosphate dehydrogenase/oxidase n=1 Tax=Sporosarcina TaxID=1569 RepID=UPI000A17C160|nr:MULTISPECIES: glycerol-3-phosphate dehydrogenase/oxidase [Sporosarcina]ARK21354.1 glycerol-3-phosphate dehydrogenase [Sporosarcina ureae]PIC94997.1 glycerol-3-phosphate dehydrogenase/oxidase [Sporosarcina sp. P26b]